jgi:hypothetical protein
MNVMLVPDDVIVTADGSGFVSEPCNVLVHGGSLVECSQYCELYFNDWSKLGDLILTAPGTDGRPLWLAWYTAGGWRNLSHATSVPTPDDFDNDGKPLWIVE